MVPHPTLVVIEPGIKSGRVVASEVFAIAVVEDSVKDKKEKKKKPKLTSKTKLIRGKRRHPNYFKLTPRC